MIDIIDGVYDFGGKSTESREDTHTTEEPPRRREERRPSRRRVDDEF